MGTIIDAGFAVIVLVAAIVGLAVGFSKQFSHPMCVFIALFGAIGLTLVLYTVISPLDFYAGLEAKATGWFGAEFYLQEASDVESLTAILDSGYLRILSGSAETLWESMQAAEVTTLGAYFGALTIRVLAKFLLWVVLYLAIKYLLYGIKYLMTKISRVVVFKSVDRIFGLVWSLVLTYIIVVSIVLTTGELVLSQFLPDVADTVTGYLAEAGFAKFFHNTNIIGSFISDLLGWSLLPNV